MDLVKHKYTITTNKNYSTSDKKYHNMNDFVSHHKQIYICGECSGSHKLHLVTWDNVCRDKNAGGLGLQYARHLNLAFMSKLGWGLIHKRDELWVQVLRSRYRYGTDLEGMYLMFGRAYALPGSLLRIILFGGLVMVAPFHSGRTNGCLNVIVSQLMLRARFLSIIDKLRSTSLWPQQVHGIGICFHLFCPKPFVTFFQDCHRRLRVQGKTL